MSYKAIGRSFVSTNFTALEANTCIKIFFTQSPIYLSTRSLFSEKLNRTRNLFRKQEHGALYSVIWFSWDTSRTLPDSREIREEFSKILFSV